MTFPPFLLAAGLIVIALLFLAPSTVGAENAIAEPRLFYVFGITEGTEGNTVESDKMAILRIEERGDSYMGYLIPIAFFRDDDIKPGDNDFLSVDLHPVGTEALDLKGFSRLAVVLPERPRLGTRLVGTLKLYSGVDVKDKLFVSRNFFAGAQ